MTQRRNVLLHCPFVALDFKLVVSSVSQSQQKQTGVKDIKQFSSLLRFSNSKLKGFNAFFFFLVFCFYGHNTIMSVGYLGRVGGTGIKCSSSSCTGDSSTESILADVTLELRSACGGLQKQVVAKWQHEGHHYTLVMVKVSRNLLLCFDWKKKLQDIKFSINFRNFIVSRGCFPKQKLFSEPRRENLKKKKNYW